MSKKFFNGDYSAFKRVESWVFDLDNTLYPADTNLFAQIDLRMGGFIADFLDVSFEEARRIQKDYYYKYGTTLAGLMHEHKLAPEVFLDYVHDIDLAPISPSPLLGEAIAALPGRKFVFTNGSQRHAERITEKLGVAHLFHGLFDIRAAGFVPKPRAEAYGAFLKTFGVAARSAAMFEDLPHNLETPHALGMATVLVRSTYNDHPAQRAIADWEKLPAHIHHYTEDLTDFLNRAGGIVAKPKLTSAE